MSFPPVVLYSPCISCSSVRAAPLVNSPRTQLTVRSKETTRSRDGSSSARPVRGSRHGLRLREDHVRRGGGGLAARDLLDHPLHPPRRGDEERYAQGGLRRGRSG